jgi:hypothetical protein
MKYYNNVCIYWLEIKSNYIKSHIRDIVTWHCLCYIHEIKALLFISKCNNYKLRFIYFNCYFIIGCCYI